MPKKNQKNQIVVYQSQAKKKPQQQKAQPKKQLNKLPKAVSSQSGALRSYACALMSPFDARALGAKIPDMYSYPVATYHSEGTVTLSSNSAGVASVLITPDPFCTMVDMTTTSVNSSSMTAYTSTPVAYASATIGNMSNLLTNYRVVGGGISIRNLLPPTTATGRLIAATVPMSDQTPGPNFLANIISNNFYVGSRLIGADMTVSATGGLTAGILNLPGAKELTIQDLIAESLDIHFKPVSPNAFEFKSASGQAIAAAGTIVTTAAAVATGTGVVYSSSADSWASAAPTGFDCILLRFEGLPANSVVADLKYILHFEGTPKVSGGAGNLVPATEHEPVVNVAGHQRVLDSVLTMPNIMMGFDAVASGIAGYAAGGVPGAIASVIAKIGMTF